MSLKLSVIIPARNEEKNIPLTCRALAGQLTQNGIDYEIVVVNDRSTDGTAGAVDALSGEFPRIRRVDSPAPHGFGIAIRKGLEVFSGDAACIVMADLSDSPEDVIRYYRELERGAECVFGSRFLRGSRVHRYPAHKFLINRLANKFIQMLFGLDHNDITNAFKCYRREVIEGIKPLLSHHFNITVELPLKAVVRGYRYAKIPVSWTNRVHGASNLKLKEMGSRYLFIVLYVWLEKILSKGDYRRHSASHSSKAGATSS